MKTIVFIPEIEHNGHIIEDATIVNETVPVFVNFDQSLPPIGIATLSKDENGVVYAEFQTNENLKGLFPAIGGQYINDSTIKIGQIGVCSHQNTDPKIKAIE